MVFVEQVYPGRYVLVKVATIKTNAGSTRRPIHKLVIPPQEVKFKGL
jgi:hypothetical protein